MRFLALYLRSRRVPMALAGAAGTTAAMWLLAQETLTAVVLTVLLAVATATVTLGGPDDSLDRTASRPWWWLRIPHALLALGVVLALVLGIRFGPAAVVVRDAAGLLGLTALGAVVVGPARAWFLPLVWTLIALTFPLTGTWGALATWPAQAPGSRPATVLAGVFAVAGLVLYAARGPRPRVVSE